jgi:hypothetical protein
MLSVLIMLTHGQQNEFIECQKGKVHDAALQIIDVKAYWNCTLELLEQGYQLQEFTCE